MAGDEGPYEGWPSTGATRGWGIRPGPPSTPDRAADLAMAAQGYEEAAGYCERALATIDDDTEGSDGSDALRGPLLVQLGTARHAAGDGGIAREAFRAAVRIGQRRRDGSLLQRAALGLGGVWDSPALVDAELRATLDEALALVGDAEPSLRVELMARAAHAREDVELAAAAVAAARRLDDPGPC